MHGEEPGPGRSLRTIVLALGFVAGSRPVAAETFPSSLDPAIVQDWLRRETGASPDQIVAISASAATRILSIEDTAPGRRRVLVEAQALNAQTAARTGVLAWRMPLDVDCGLGLVKLGPTTGFASRRGVGPGLALRAADPAWRAAPVGTQLEFLRNAACHTRTVAQAAPQKPPQPAKPPHGAPPAGGLAAQVISTPNPAEAEAALRRLQLRYSPKTAQLQAAVTRAEVNGSTTYRGMLTGFPSREAATAFCAELKDAHQGCFLRQAPGLDRPLKPVATR